MELTGKLIWADELKSGISAKSGNSWTKQNFCIEYIVQTPNMDFTGHLVFSYLVTNSAPMPNVGDEVKIKYSINANKFEDNNRQIRWFNDVKASEVEVIKKANESPNFAKPQEQAPAQQAAPAQEQAPQLTPEEQKRIDEIRAQFAKKEKESQLPF